MNRETPHLTSKHKQLIIEFDLVDIRSRPAHLPEYLRRLIQLRNALHADQWQDTLLRFHEPNWTKGRL